MRRLIQIQTIAISAIGRNPCDDNRKRIVIEVPRGARSASEGGKTSTNGRKSSTDGVRCSTSGRKSSTGGRKCSTNGGKWSANRKKSSTEGRKSSTNGEKPSTEGGTPSTNGIKPSIIGRIRYRRLQNLFQQPGVGLHRPLPGPRKECIPRQGETLRVFTWLDVVGDTFDVMHPVVRQACTTHFDQLPGFENLPVADDV